MTGAVIAIALGMFALNLGALIAWAVVYRPHVVVTSGREHDPTARTWPQLADVVRRIASRWRDAIEQLGRSPIEPSAPPEPQPTPSPLDLAADAVDDGWDGGARELIERLETSPRPAAAEPATATQDDDPERWWRAWAEADGNDAPAAAGSGRREPRPTPVPPHGGPHRRGTGLEMKERS